MISETPDLKNRLTVFQRNKPLSKECFTPLDLSVEELEIQIQRWEKLYETSLASTEDNEMGLLRSTLVASHWPPSLWLRDYLVTFEPFFIREKRKDESQRKEPYLWLSYLDAYKRLTSHGNMEIETGAWPHLTHLSSQRKEYFFTIYRSESENAVLKGWIPHWEESTGWKYPLNDIQVQNLRIQYRTARTFLGYLSSNLKKQNNNDDERPSPRLTGQS